MAVEHSYKAENPELRVCLNQRDRLRTILDTIPDLVWLKSAEGAFLECNSRFQSLLGTDLEGIVGKTDYDFVPHDVADFFRQNDLAALQAQGPRRNEEWVTFADGHAEMLETIKRPLYENGRLIGVLGIGRDLTQNYADRQHLRASQERLRMFLENAPAAVAMVDKEMCYLLVSRRFASDFGLDTDDLEGRCHYDVFPELPQRWRDTHQRCLAGAVERCDEDSFTRADGSVEWLRWEVRPWYDAEGAVGGVILFSEVITAAKNAELQLRATEERFRAAQRMEAVGRLAGGVAHDFNNLLTVIVSYSELAKKDLDPDHPIQHDLEEILAASKRAESLTRQLLTFSRSQVTTVEPVDFSNVVSALSGMLRRLIGEDIEVTFSSNPLQVWVQGDRGQLEQVVMNLAINARDAMLSGGKLQLDVAAVELSLAQSQLLGLTPGPYARLQVSDTGCGMDEEVRQSIFEPFFTTKGLGKGTGLGLSTVYGIIQQSGGSIDVQTRPGAGTRFEVYLPAHSPSQAPSPLGRTEKHGPVGRSHILVVEDEEGVRKVLRRVLESAGYLVSVAPDAEQALDLARQGGAEYDLILSDVIMPGMNGCEMMELLLPMCPGARHLFMSGYTDDVLERFAIPREKVLPKPFDRKTLTALIQGILS